MNRDTVPAEYTGPFFLFRTKDNALVTVPRTRGTLLCHEMYRRVAFNCNELSTNLQEWSQLKTTVAGETSPYVVTAKAGARKKKYPQDCGYLTGPDMSAVLKGLIYQLTMVGLR